MDEAIFPTPKRKIGRGRCEREMGDGELDGRWRVRWERGEEGEREKETGGLIIKLPSQKKLASIPQFAHIDLN